MGKSKVSRPFFSMMLAMSLCAPACSDQGAPSRDEGEPPLRSTAHALIPEPEALTGATLAEKELVLTFDDGPGPMEVTGELSTWLKNRPTPIRATFFVVGACVAATAMPNETGCETPIDGAADILAKLVADGHTVANHTTTHRDLRTLSAAEHVAELTETDAQIAPYVPWNRFFFRAPLGGWDTAIFTNLSKTAMTKYVGPIYWDIGGGDTNGNRAADWECWNERYTTKRCGDLYLKETRALGKGIVLMHDPHGDTTNHDIAHGRGNTIDMVKYIVPILESEGYTFKALDEVPRIAEGLATCDVSCKTCSGPRADQCTACEAGKFTSSGTCAPCTACEEGTYMSAACTATSDTVCASCSECNDNDVCTTDHCSPAGCTHTPIAGCVSNNSGTNPGSGTPNDSSGDGSGCNVSPSPLPGRAAGLLFIVLAFGLRARRRAGSPTGDNRA